nr:EOG090X0JRY [Triops cancriformis]
MESVSNLVRVSLPNYLAGLPIPNSIGGWFRLGVRDWATLIPFGAAVAGISYLTYEKVQQRVKGTPINPSIKKDVPKVVDTFEIEDLGEKTYLCRCWKSAKFPYCDGAHSKHNKETGDNVGPAAIIKKTA